MIKSNSLCRVCQGSGRAHLFFSDYPCHVCFSEDKGIVSVQYSTAQKSISGNYTVLDERSLLAYFDDEPYSNAQDIWYLGEEEREELVLERMRSLTSKGNVWLNGLI